MQLTLASRALQPRPSARQNQKQRQQQQQQRRTAGAVKVLAFQPTSPSPASSSSNGDQTKGQGVAPSRVALLAAFNPSTRTQKNVYGKALSKGEQTALEAAVQHWGAQLAPSSTTRDALREQLLAYLQDAVENRKASLPVVEGTMQMLELMHLEDAPEGAVAGGATQLKGAWTQQEMSQCWQLVIGADVGGIQYIPVIERLTVHVPDFELAADLGGAMHMGFKGVASWLAPGHLRYTTQRVRLELCLPEGWERGLRFLGWRSQQASSGAKHYNERGPPPLDAPAAKLPAWQSDPSRPAVTFPVPFPANEIFCFASNGKVAGVRSSLGGLIVLLNKSV